MSLNIQKKFTVRSNRVKCVDHHNTEPWILCSLYSGDVTIWNYKTQFLIKSLKICEVPVRTARFVSRKNWIVSGADDSQIRIHNYNTLEKIHSFEAHSDIIRCIIVHPTDTYVLSCSDDLLIKLWNWNPNWFCQQVFEGHTNFIMDIAINPKDTKTFASASLDTTIKMWKLESKSPAFTLTDRTYGVNCLDFYNDEKSDYLVSGGEDGLVKIWDYQTRICIKTLDVSAQNIWAITCHGEIPFLFAGYEDGIVRIWHTPTFKLKSTLNFALQRVWTMSCIREDGTVAIGYDEGAICISVGKNEPPMTMKGTKIIWTKHSELKQINLNSLCTKELKDGDYLITLVSKDKGSCDISPQEILYNSNGKYFAIYGDGEYTIYTSVAFRKKAFGEAQQFVWSFESLQYAVLNHRNTITVFNNFKERNTVNFLTENPVEHIFGGRMLGVKSTNGLITFYDWEHLRLVRVIEIEVQNVYWSNTGSIVCLTSQGKYHMLKYNERAVASQQKNIKSDDDCVEDAFVIIDEVNETITSGLWFGDCFIYTDAENKLRYTVGGVTVTISNINNPLHILGYIPEQNKLYLNDKKRNIIPYTLLSTVLEYQTAIVRNDLDTADGFLSSIPEEYRTQVAQFLEHQGFIKKALSISIDINHRFELALSLGELNEAKFCEQTTSKHHLSKLAMLATVIGDTELVKICYLKAKDYGALLLFAINTGDKNLLEEVARLSDEQGYINIAFIAYFTLNKLDQCLHLLISSNNIPQAAFFARSYYPTKIADVVNMWRKSDVMSNIKLKQMLADPVRYQNLFPEYA